MNKSFMSTFIGIRSVFFYLFYGLPLNENSIEINEIKTQLK